MNTIELQAALATPLMKSCAPLLQAAGFDIKGPMKPAEVSAKLRDSALSVGQKIELKAAMARAGLLFKK